MSFGRFLYLAALLAGFGPSLSGCSVAGDEDPTGDIHAYRYEAFDASGVQVALGELSIVFQVGTVEDDCQMRCVEYRLSGTRDIAAIGEDRSLGFQGGRGDLIGWIYETGEVTVNLHPHVEDGNTYLRGVFEGQRFDELDGTWDDTYGPDGTFSAHRK